MAIGQALVLGAVQGLTEFLPISSSGHLIFIPKLFGWADQGLAFDAVVHLGTLVAVVVFFRLRLFSLIKDAITTPSPSPTRGGNTDIGARLGWFILLSVIPVGLVGFLFGDWIEAHTRSAAVVAWSLIGWGIVLGVADRVSRERQSTPHCGAQKHLSDLTWREILFIACAQAIALIPGTSRSGITMTAGLFSRLDKKSAAEWSFLISIPVIALAGFYKTYQLVNIGAIGQLDNLIIGFLTSAIAGFTAIWGLMKIIQKWSFMPFVVYRVAVGAAILIWM